MEQRKRLTQPLRRSPLVVFHHVPQSVFHRRSNVAQHEGACQLGNDPKFKSVRRIFFSSPYVPPGGCGGSSLPSQSTHGMVIVVLPTLVRGCWLFVECGSSASGHRRSLRYEVRALHLPQVSNLREVGDNRLHEVVRPTHGSARTIYECSGHHNSARSPTQFGEGPLFSSSELQAKGAVCTFV